uniref:Proteasome activator subunit 3 interacting protein 1 n=1 Tax=Erpetoichthys calabaricus TaxID=27687 RepID=A0A8C4X6R8_ERPCA
MMAGTGEELLINNKFVSETQIEERRKKRQEEWEKVRKPDDPEECPEEVYDPRSLYERLQEQKEKKQLEFEEQFKFKNMVKGLDEDETNFLDEVSRQQELIEKQRRDEDMKELHEYRNALSKLPTNIETRSNPEKKPSSKMTENKNMMSQAKLLAGAVKRRSLDNSESVKKQKVEKEEDRRHEAEADCHGEATQPSGLSMAVLRPSAAVCVGILPGLGAYSGSSDSDSSSDSEV